MLGRSVLVIVGILMAGCLATPENPPSAPASTHTMPLAIRIVPVGFPAFDAAALEAKLVEPLYSFKMIRASTTLDFTPEKLQYDVTYEVLQAPETFAMELFEYAKTVSTEGTVDAWLTDYDLTGPKRACTETSVPVVGERLSITCKPLQRIDAGAVETWIHENAPRFGLDVPTPGYTFYVLDSYTNAYLPREEYHQYKLAGQESWPQTQNQRMWGGAYEFIFLDVGAAPSAWDYRPWANFSYDKTEGTDLIDAPIWDLEKTPAMLYENLARNVVDATELLWARKPIYPVEHADRYILPLYVIVEPEAFANPQSPLYRLDPHDVEKNTDAALIQEAFEELVPWADVDLRVEFVYLPEDDPALADVLQDAKNRYTTTDVDFGIVKKYFRENWDTYVDEEPGARSYPTFVFVLETPTASTWAYSDGDELGNSWGVFANVADVFTCTPPRPPVCSAETLYSSPELFKQFWNGLIIHELGHSFGLTHPHDTSGIDDRGLATYELNRLLDSTSSDMTYRHWLGRFDQFDFDFVLRAHTVEIASVLGGLSEDPDSPGAHAAADALGFIDAGDYPAALDAARLGWIAAGRPSLAEGIPQIEGKPVSTTRVVTLAAGASPGGGAPVYAPLPVYPEAPFREGTNYASWALEFPPDATAVLLEYEEADAPRHDKWNAFVGVLDKDDVYITGLYNNGYDKGYLLDLDRCEGGCRVELYAWSGVNLEYEVTTTVFTPN